MSEIIKELKNLLRITDNEEDSLLKALVNNAVSWIEVECNLEDLDIEDMDRGMRSLLLDMVIFRYTVVGKEGINNERIVELSYSYNNDYPDYIKRRLLRFRRIRVH